MIYFSILIYLFYNSLKFEIIKSRKKIFLFTIILVFILAFNYKMGSDWLNYQRIYDIEIRNYTIKNIIFNNPFSQERGYLLLNILGKKLGLNYEIFMGIILSFNIIILLKIGRLKAKNIYFFIFIILTKYILIASLEPTVRQFLATSIITFGYKYIEEKNLKKYLLCIILAMQFHISAILGVCIYFLENFNITIKKVILLLIFFPLLIKIIPTGIEIVSNFIPEIQKYNKYFTSDYFRYGVSISRSLLGNIYHFVLMILYLYFIFFSNAKKQKNYIKNMAIVYILIEYFKNILPILDRLESYFILGFAISMSYIGSMKYNKKKVGIIFLFLIYLIMINELINNLYGKELNKKRYGEYKNYFIELILEKTNKNFQEKSYNYEKEIKKMIEEENNKRMLVLKGRM